MVKRSCINCKNETSSQFRICDKCKFDKNISISLTDIKNKIKLTDDDLAGEQLPHFTFEVYRTHCTKYLLEPVIKLAKRILETLPDDKRKNKMEEYVRQYDAKKEHMRQGKQNRITLIENLKTLIMKIDNHDLVNFEDAWIKKYIDSVKLDEFNLGSTLNLCIIQIEQTIKCILMIKKAFSDYKEYEIKAINDLHTLNKYTEHDTKSLIEKYITIKDKDIIKQQMRDELSQYILENRVEQLINHYVRYEECIEECIKSNKTKKDTINSIKKLFEYEISIYSREKEIHDKFILTIPKKYRDRIKAISIYKEYIDNGGDIEKTINDLRHEHQSYIQKGKRQQKINELVNYTKYSSIINDCDEYNNYVENAGNISEAVKVINEKINQYILKEKRKKEVSELLNVTAYNSIINSCDEYNNYVENAGNISETIKAINEKINQHIQKKERKKEIMELINFANYGSMICNYDEYNNYVENGGNITETIKAIKAKVEQYIKEKEEKQVRKKRRGEIFKSINFIKYGSIVNNYDEYNNYVENGGNITETIKAIKAKIEQYIKEKGENRATMENKEQRIIHRLEEKHIDIKYAKSLQEYKQYLINNTTNVNYYVNEISKRYNTVKK